MNVVERKDGRKAKERKRAKAFYSANRDRILAKRRERRRETGDVADRVRRAKVKAATGRPYRISRALRRKLLATYPVCVCCGKPLEPGRFRWPDPRAVVVGHLLPASRGGPSIPANLRPMHNACNGALGTDLLPFAPRSAEELYGGIRAGEILGAATDFDFLFPPKVRPCDREGCPNTVRPRNRMQRFCCQACRFSARAATKPSAGTCEDCGAEYPMNQGRGRARKRCDPCRESARAGTW